MLGWKKGTPAKKNCFAWLVENKGNPKKAKKQKGQLILGKYASLSLQRNRRTDQKEEKGGRDGHTESVV